MLPAGLGLEVVPSCSWQSVTTRESVTGVLAEGANVRMSFNANSVEYQYML